MGLGVAGQHAASSTTAPSADPDGHPWSERKRYVWWDAEEGQWTSVGDHPDFVPDRPPDYEPSGGRRGDGRAPRDRRRSSPTRTASAGCGRRPGWSTGRCRPTTSRTSRRSTTRSTRSAGEPDARSSSTGPTTRTTRRGSRRLPVRAHDLPADRAPHGRRHVADACRTCPSCSPSCSSRSAPSSRPSAGSSTPAGRRRHDAHGDRGARDGHRPHPAAARSAGRVVHQVGLPYHWGRKGLVTGDAANELLVAGARPQRAHHRVQGRSPATSARPPAARPALTGSASYRRRAALRATLTSDRRAWP